jgi:tripartite-type tricarboxylate transporter receptor subunit TctC
MNRNGGGFTMHATQRVFRSVLAALCALALPAAAQDFPSRPLKVVAFYAAGGPSDFAARLVSEKLQQKLGQPVVVENKPGAALRLGTEFVARSAPDGYTIGVTGGPHATNPALYANLPYDTLKDLAGLAHLVDAPLAISVPAASPIRTLKDYVEAGKAKRGALTVATAGNGTTTHLTAELLFLEAGATFTHVPYKGDAPAVTELLSGRVDSGANTLQSVLQHIRAGRLRGVAVGTKERVAQLPDVPTIAEQGYPDIVVSAWFGMIVPAGVPRDIVHRLNRDINEVLAMPDVREKLATAGLVPVGGTAEQFDAHIRAEIERWGRVIKARGIKAE